MVTFAEQPELGESTGLEYHLIDSETWIGKDAMDPEVLLFPPTRWGRNDTLYTAAYWADVVEAEAGRYLSGSPHRLGSTFIEECAACLLGGHGIPAEVGIAAFEALKRTGLLSCSDASVDDVFRELSRPIQMHNGKLVKYRFAKQKSGYLAKLLASKIDVNRYSSHRELRDDLMDLPGFGFKTASWVVRNWFDSDMVAILDIHIHRAGLLAGFFDPSNTLPRDYLLMERRFLAFALLIGARPSVLDAIMWEHLKRDGDLVFSCLAISKAA